MRNAVTALARSGVARMADVVGDTSRRVTTYDAPRRATPMPPAPSASVRTLVLGAPNGPSRGAGGAAAAIAAGARQAAASPATTPARTPRRITRR